MTDNEIIDKILQFLYDNQVHNGIHVKTYILKKLNIPYDKNQYERVYSKLTHSNMVHERESIIGGDDSLSISGLGIDVVEKHGSFSAFDKIRFKLDYSPEVLVERLLLDKRTTNTPRHPQTTSNGNIPISLTSRLVKVISNHISVIISGIIIALVAGYMLYYFRLNGDRPRKTQPTTETTTTIKQKP